ncbi:hypothetical protein C8A01DRAFT_13888, partial [Parachaetomium inaequale]
VWLMKRSRMDNDADVCETGCQPVPKQHIANFSYPRTYFVHLYRKEQPGARDSQGSESSPPLLVEDHGSDLSAEDDSQYRVSGAELWNSWQAREEARRQSEPDHRAPVDSTGTREDGPKDSPTTSGPSSSGSHSGQATRRVVVSCPEQRPHAPKLPPKVCYSLFPPPSVPPKRVPVPLQVSTVPPRPGLEPSPLSLTFPPTPISRKPIPDGKSHTTMTFKPSSPRATTPRPVHGGSIAASSSDSIPLLLRSPGPTPPDSPAATVSSAGSPTTPSSNPMKKRPPSHTNLRNFSLSKITTRSSPSPANLAKAQRQGQPQAPDLPPLPNNINNNNKLPPPPTTPADIYDRPLPPLPTEKRPPPKPTEEKEEEEERPPTPPHISVFETDSDDDDEDGGNSRPGSGEMKGFARRFMHGLVYHNHHHHSHHHNHNDRKGLLGPGTGSTGSEHKRSVSDEGPGTVTSKEKKREKERGGGGRSGISRTLGAAARYRRGGAAAAEGVAARGAVSMDLPREGGGRSQQIGEEQEKGGRFWGRILRRRGN